jgi:hypothetical protein
VVGVTTQPRKGFVQVDPKRREPPPPLEPPVAEEPDDEPTDEQLMNVAVVLGFPIMTTPLMRKLPYWRESMLNLHRLTQQAINGDEAAARTLAAMQAAFGGPE